LAVVIGDLEEAVRHYHLPDVDRTCQVLIAGLRDGTVGLDDRLARHVLRLLRRKRLFGRMASMSEALLAAGHRSAGIRCDYAQALIDQGMPAAALDMLEGAAHDATDPADASEARGLLGRAFKQMYINSADVRWLVEAVAVYSGAYQRDPVRCGWHGINAAALLKRAARDGIVLGDFPDPDPVAQGILNGVETRWVDSSRPSTAWDAAVAIEACLVLDRPNDALRWLQRYVEDPRADAFELSSTLRQLVEVWRLDARTEPGCRLLPVIRAAVLGREEGARIELEQRDLAGRHEPDEALEKVLGQSGMVSHTWYRRGLGRSLAVARVEHEGGRPVGTGFLVASSSLGRTSGLLLVTNSHVLSPNPSTDETLSPDRAVASLSAASDHNGARRSRVAEIVWTSPPRDLDVTVARLEQPVDDIEPCPVTSARPRLDGKQRVYVIGHPEGRELSYSIDDNVLLDYDDRVMHYRAPTEHGSSGSPVFNRDWDVVAVHHAGRLDMPRLHGEGAYPANEGIWIEAVRTAMASGS
jgi:V8-like Glu-specific endopeptidase